MRRDYTANAGWETFLAYEDPRQDILVGLLRLRKVSGPLRERQPQLLGSCSIVRELHVYGTAVAVHSRDSSKHQHQVRSDGFGVGFVQGRRRCNSKVCYATRSLVDAASAPVITLLQVSAAQSEPHRQHPEQKLSNE